MSSFAVRPMPTTASWVGTRPAVPPFADLAGIAAGQRVLDVGCGPGALTAELVDRVGAAVAAVDPSEPFVAAARSRQPGVSVQRASAEQLPFPDAAFDAALAQLVVHFMATHHRSRGDAAGHASGWRRRRLRLGSRRRAGTAERVLGPVATSIPRSRTSRTLVGTQQGDLARPVRGGGAAGGRGDRALGRGSSIRASRSGGSPSHSESARPASTWRGSSRNDARRCVNTAARRCPSRRSC